MSNASVSSNLSSSENEYDRAKPVTKRKGWEGEEMEMNHQRQHLQNNKNSSKFTAVDLSQFRNTEVGVGYQAKGVVRQRSLTVMEESKTGSTVKDMSKRKATTSKLDDNGNEPQGKREGSRSTKRSKQKEREVDCDAQNETNFSSVQKYLQCKGLRDFRREIEKILNEDSLRASR